MRDTLKTAKPLLSPEGAFAPADWQMLRQPFFCDSESFVSSVDSQILFAVFRGPAL